jgi:FKBP-type peptidyl-prolyl cis-trans isomerase
MNMKNQAGNAILWFVIVAVVLGALVFLTVKGRPATEDTQVGQVEQAIENMETNNGVKITVVQEGAGEPVKEGDSVAMNYTGSLENGTVFDSNVDPAFGHAEPFVFTLGGGQVIQGWEIGVLGMKVGEKRTLVINPENAYGEFGVSGVIPPNATLTFEVELIAVQK